MADYTERALAFKIRKSLRYARLYGFQRVFYTVRGQYHVKKVYGELPPIRTEEPTGKNVGLIGCGIFGFNSVGYYLKKNYGRCVLRAAMDTNPHRAASLFQHFGLDYYTTDADRLLDDPEIDLIFVASKHSSHTPYAIRALERGKAVHIEKPHVTSETQLRELCSAMRRTGGKVRLGFNRPLSPLGLLIKRYLDEQTGPVMQSWSVPVAPLPADHWFFEPAEGGRVLGNFCHYTDLVYQWTAPEKRYPIEIHPIKFDKPDENVVVVYRFGDGSMATIAFSAAGSPFEGDKERVTLHRNECILSMEDFHRVLVEVEHKKQVIAPFRRDHGHTANMRLSYEMVRPGSSGLNPGCDIDYVWNTGMLFLKTKQALDSGEIVTIPRGFQEADLSALAA